MFDILIYKGKGIEINTSGLRTIGETMPPAEILHWYKARGGDIITLGSDAHTAGNVSFGIRQGYDLLKSAGFKKTAIYDKRKLSFKEI